MVVSSAGCGSFSHQTIVFSCLVYISNKTNSRWTNGQPEIPFQMAMKNDTSYKSADEITMDDLMSHDETEDFEFNDSTDNIIIEKYVGKGNKFKIQVVVIPLMK